MKKTKAFFRQSSPKRQNFFLAPAIIKGQHQTGREWRLIVTIYADVLIGLNLYITWFLLLAAERFAGRKSPVWRRGLASLAGGIASLSILLPELPFWTLFFTKLGLAAIITLIAGGYGGWRFFCKRMLLFFAVNFLFAGFMIALWLLAAPPRLTIRNGNVYYHIPAMTLAISTILAYGAARLLCFFLERRTPEAETFQARAGLGGREILLTVFIDTGNRLKSASGLPVILCEKERLAELLSPEVAAALASPAEAAALSGSLWGSRLRFLPCETVGGSRLLCGIEPDFFRPEGGENIPCVLAASERKLSDGEYQAVAGALEGLTVPRNKTGGSQKYGHTNSN